MKWYQLTSKEVRKRVKRLFSTERNEQQLLEV